MNYFEKHIGDYIKDTVSLSMLEDGAYNRLIDQCYQTEQPLPLDRKEIYRLARAGSAPERKAVDYVVSKYFQQTDAGYTQKRVQEQIERYWERDQSDELRRENDRDRQQRTRERRKALFEELRNHGIVPEFNTPTRQLSLELSRVTDRDNHATVTCDNTATQTPDTRHHIKPKAKPHRVDSTANTGASDPEQSAAEPRGVSAVGALCIAMRSAGIDAQPADPRMIALAEQGVEPETVAAACADALRAKPGERVKPGYVLAILDRWSREAAALKVAGAAQPRASPAYQTANEKAKDFADRLTGKKRHEQPANNLIIDINDTPS